MKGITHQELYKSLSKLENISQDKAKKIMNTLLDILKENIENGNSINLKGIGTFSVIEKEPREAYDHFRNTKTKVPKRRYLKFKTSSNIKKYFSDKKHSFKTWIPVMVNTTDSNTLNNTINS